MENTIKIESLRGKNYKDVEGLVINDTCSVVLKKTMVETVTNMLVHKDEYGICPHCNNKLRNFDTDSQGGRGYKCNCGYYTWVSYNCVDKNFYLNS